MRISVFVKICSKKNKVEVVSKNILKVYVTEKPVDGKANAMIIKILANHFSVPSSYVVLYRGRKSRVKLFDIVL